MGTGNAAFIFYSTVIDRSPAAPAPDPRLPPQSCLLLPPTPVRGGQKAVVSRKTNMHIFIESGLRVRINPKVRPTALGRSVPFPAAESLVLLISTVNVFLWVNYGIFVKVHWSIYWSLLVLTLILWFSQNWWFWLNIYYGFIALPTSLQLWTTVNSFKRWRAFKNTRLIIAFPFKNPSFASIYPRSEPVLQLGCKGLASYCTPSTHVPATRGFPLVLKVSTLFLFQGLTTYSSLYPVPHRTLRLQLFPRVCLPG